MKSSGISQNQSNLFQSLLIEMINQNHRLVHLSKAISWEELDKEFEHLYSSTGRPAKPIRLMCSLLILKQIYSLSDEGLIDLWIENPYYQYFSGFDVFQKNYPCDPTDLVYFRKRIGSKGVEKILEISVKIHGKQATSHVVTIDSTVQPKNITYPTDAKLRRRIIEKCKKIAEETGVNVRQSYARVLKKLFLDVRFSGHPKRRKQAGKANKKLKTIAGRLIRELRRKIPAELLLHYQSTLDMFQKVIDQKRGDSNKIYSLHELDVACIAKGKSANPYEFGSKVSIAVNPLSNIILAATNFTGNPHDSKTLESTFEQMERMNLPLPKYADTDRGYRGVSEVKDVAIRNPYNVKSKTKYQKSKARKIFRRRAGIEPIIGHLKSDHRMRRNFLKGIVGDEINAVMAAASFNFRKWMNNLEETLRAHIFFVAQSIRIIFHINNLQITSKFPTY